MSKQHSLHTIRCIKDRPPSVNYVQLIVIIKYLRNFYTSRIKRSNYELVLDMRKSINTVTKMK